MKSALHQLTVLGLLSLGSATLADIADLPQGAVVFQRQYFDKFNPVSALDMVLNVPGFFIDDGRNVRGYEATAGNVLINGERPVSKSRTLEEILAQFPASAVDRIVLLSGSAELLGNTAHAMIVDVVLGSSTQDSSYAYEISGSLRAGEDVSHDASVSALRQLQGVTVSVALRTAERRDRSDGPETVSVNESVIERRAERQRGADRTTVLSFTADWDRVAGGRMELGGQYQTGVESFAETSARRRVDSPLTSQFRAESTPYDTFEFTSAYERRLSTTGNFQALLVINEERFTQSSTSTRPTLGLSERARTDRRRGESILAVTADWTLSRERLLRIGAEYGETFVDNEFSLFEDMGSGEAPVDTPGANTRVEETRLEGFVSYSAPLASSVRLDSRLTVEASEISQIGDIENVRRFTFLKPRLGLTHRVNSQSQWRFSVERTVGQLDFADFVSHNDFDDGEFEFGNPDLKPDRRWRLATEYERQFGDEGLIQIGAFGELVEDAQDLLPLGGIFEIPGNIGRARVLGLTLNGTAPLTSLPWEDALLDFDFRAQRTRVTDPVTGFSRKMSNERDFRLDVEYRQAIGRRGIDFGIGLRARSSEAFFGLDELEKDFAYVETSFSATMAISKRVRLRFEGNDVFDESREQERTVFTDTRASDDVRFVERRRRRSGTEFALRVSGEF